MKLIRGSDLKYIPSSHEFQENPKVLKKILLHKDDLLPGRVQMVNWAQLQPNSTFEPHYHEDMTEVFLIIEGEVTMTIDDTKIDVKKGDAVVIEPHEVHTMTNNTNQPLEYIVFGISQNTGGKTVNV